MFIKIINRNGKKRQIKREPTTFEEVKALAEQIWGEEAKNSSIAYLDSDKELITIVNDDDWNVCLEEIEMMQEGQKVKKVTLQLIAKEELTESMRIVETEINRSESEITVDLETMMEEVENLGESQLKESAFNKVSDSVVIEETQETEPEVKPEEEEEEGEKQLLQWKMVDEPKSEEEGDCNIEEEKPVEETQEEPSVFEETENPVRLTNTAEEDVVIDIKIDGNDLEALRAQVMQMAPFMGFEVEKAEIQVKNDVPEPEMEEKEENILEDMSVCETDRSTLTHDMRDEIQRMINAKVQEQLSRTLSSMNLSSIPIPQPTKPEQKETPKPEEQVVHTGFTCDGCGVCPIVGVRFHSLHQKDYDLCEKCEKTHHNEHPMIRFRQNSHRGLAHSRGWHAIKRIVEKHGNKCQNNTNGCQRAPNPFEAINNFFKKPEQSNCTAGNNVCGPVGQVFRAIRETMQNAQERGRERRRHRNLCHIRVRNEETPAPTEEAKPEVVEQPEFVNHPRFNEFKKVFTNASDKELNEFLYNTDSITDENELYNMAIAKFLE